MTDAPWNEATAHELGIAWLEAELVPAGRLGRAALRRARAYLPGDEAVARAAIEDVARTAALAGDAMLAELATVFAALPDLATILAIARSGAAPSDADFFDAARFVAGALRLATLARAPLAREPFSRAETSALEHLAAALAPATRAEGGFYLGERLDPQLARLRDAAERARERSALARSRASAGVARALGRETLASPQFVVMRDELAGPLPPHARVVAEGATYFLCELELDDDARAALAASEAADAAVAACEEGVRVRLGALLAEHASALETTSLRAGDLDAFFARVRFARRHLGCVPEIVSSGDIELHDARFLPVESALAARGRAYVPISLSLGGAAVVTGPNMGGKSVALRTCGFALACASLGLPVPARAARVPLAAEIAWLGSQSALDSEALLSSFGREVVAARAVLEASAPRRLVLLDEFARTTSPREGRALLIALLRGLRARDCTALAATHFADVAQPAGAVHFAIAGLREPLRARAAGDAADLADALRRVAEAMDYRLVRVDPTSPDRSDALELAAALGLDAGVVAEAQALLDDGRKAG